MELNKFSREADGLGDLYRAALMLGRGKVAMGERFLKMAKNKCLKIGEVKGSENNLNLWAEKVLDEYFRLRWGIKGV